MKTAELRQIFLDYFQKLGHAVVPGCPLIPPNDPSLLFTNAGMVQFKDIFLGLEHRTYTRATSVQRCFRANDVENVGYTARHHTFFEMLGNFSFGDYFKHEAIRYAWDFLTGVLKIPPEKLWVTVYKDDDEAEKIWLDEIGFDPKRLSRLDEDNFWSMADTGPCGPSTEIFYDHGENVSGGPPGSPDEDGDRYIEIWNIVFMQYNRDKDGNLTPLPRPSIDTGSGLERLAAAMQDVPGNYDIDIFQDLIKAASRITNCQNVSHPALKIIADHIRGSAFLIMDGVFPSNEKRGYVLRRIIRRAVRQGYQLGMRKPFFYKLVAPLIKITGNAYRELEDNKEAIETIIFKEEEQFLTTITQGIQLFEESTRSLSGKIIPGEIVFKLYDTYGFPTDLTLLMAKEKGFEVDEEGFEAAMLKQKLMSRAAGRFEKEYDKTMQFDTQTTFRGYEHEAYAAQVENIFKEKQAVDTLNEDEEGILILDHTPFYAESGGQVGDTGEILVGRSVFIVEDTQKKDNAILHIGKMKSGEIQKRDTVIARIDAERRKAIAANHSAAHLLHAALKKVLGTHAAQRGSLVTPDRLRLDFSHQQPVTPSELEQVEQIVNDWVRQNEPVCTEIMSPQEAKEKGATALFGEKYGEKARVLSMGDLSTELCGGTHVKRSGDIGVFKITLETGIAAGVRRIEAATGDKAIKLIQKQNAVIKQACRLFNANAETLPEAIEQRFAEQKEIENTLYQTRNELLKYKSDDMIQQAKEISGIKFIAAALKDIDAKTLRALMDQIKPKVKGSVILLAGIQSGRKIHLIAGVTKDAVEKFSAKDLLQTVAPIIGGKGGGKADMAQGGGDKPEKLDEAFTAAEQWLRRLKNK